MPPSVSVSLVFKCEISGMSRIVLSGAWRHSGAATSTQPPYLFSVRARVDCVNYHSLKIKPMTVEVLSLKR